ncbi:hypothetical protein METHB2_20019 [Candidatus Methylobacter favarea]|uniref:Uncharacterized protein n=1 Tax=Candidatus Methylobacter favarea TaxID=2707345 RepID=A0A8S0Y9I3_9GAMM|nr:hypothetical protein [Candidatus Methylobacter favarea]CAA9890188.1 hypothetical protein METHB2_20019 [Candidatus Methylobacter favarea]
MTDVSRNHLFEGASEDASCAASFAVAKLAASAAMQEFSRKDVAWQNHVVRKKAECL